MKRYLALLACAAVPLAAAGPAAATGSGTESLALNSYETPTDGAAGPASTASALASGKFYVVTASGAFSYYSPETWADPPGPNGVVCGTPEAAPTTPSPGRPTSPAGNDVETLFALPWEFGPGCNNITLPMHWTNFQMRTSTAGGFQHVEPAGGPYSAPRPDHTYRYFVQGAGQRADFRLVDTDTTDNNGIVTISVRKADMRDCDADYAAMGFSSKAQCVCSFALNLRVPGWWKQKVSSQAPFRYR